MKNNFNKIKNIFGLAKKETTPSELGKIKNTKEIFKLQDNITALQKDVESFGSRAELEDALIKNPTIAEHIANNITFCVTALTGLGVLGLAAFVTKEASEKNLNNNLTGFIILGLIALGSSLVYFSGTTAPKKELGL